VIEYTLRPGTRWGAKIGRDYPVREILVDGELVGAFWEADYHLFGEVQQGDQRYPHGDCTRAYSRSADFMVGMIMRHRQVGDRPDWRSAAAAIPIPKTREVTNPG
jgi:hypothetical protein